MNLGLYHGPFGNIEMLECGQPKHFQSQWQYMLLLETKVSGGRKQQMEATTR